MSDPSDPVAPEAQGGPAETGLPGPEAALREILAGADHLAGSFGSFLTGVMRAQPEATDRLLGATHEVLQALRQLLDAADEIVEHKREDITREHQPRVQRIPVD